MPSKRRATAESDDEQGSYGNSSPASKRARLDEEDSEDEAPRAGQSRARHSSKKHTATRAEEEEDGDDDEIEETAGAPEVEPTNDLTDEQFEEQHAELFRANIESKSKTHGGIADHGVIEYIEMHQFMCHKFLTFAFGPQINFIIGHNGSGKSAVLSAITVALGGKATTTGRGSGLKSFIREGQSVSEVTIHIKNQGEEAYKPHEFGKTIVITRRFTKDGSSTWKIKSKDGRIISNKREDLSAICDHMNIQVDNPMNVLTQDSARQFLSASTPGDKYKFFLKGTQLSQLSDEYDLCMERIRETVKVVAQKREALPDLIAANKEANHRLEEAQKARDQRHKLDDLKKELAWAHVAEKEKEMRSSFEDAMKLERKIPKIEKSLNDATAKFDAATEAVTRLEAEHEAMGNVEELEGQRKILSDEMRTNKNKIQALKLEERDMDNNIKAINKTIRGLEQQIEEETRKAEGGSVEKRAETMRRLTAAKEAFKDLESKSKAVLEALREKEQELKVVSDEGKAAGTQKEQQHQTLMQSEAAIQHANEATRNSMAVYGAGMPRALEEIKRTNWKGRPPVGPFGLFVKLKDPKWARVLRIAFGSQMFSFGITDPQDRPALKKILESNRCQVNILVSQNEIFDFSHGEPDPHVLTILRALEISDPYVLRTLINVARIEKIQLYDTRREADVALRAMRGAANALTADRYSVRVYGDGGAMSQPLSDLNPGDPKNQLFPERDPGSQLRVLQESHHQLESEYRAATDLVNRCRDKYKVVNEELKQLKAKEKSYGTQVVQARLHREKLQDEANEDLPVGATAYQEAKQEAEDEKEGLLNQFRNLTEQRIKLDETQRPLLAQMNGIKAQIDSFEEGKAGIRKQVEDAVTDRLQASGAKSHWERKLADEQAKVEQAKATAEEVQTEYQSWTEAAMKFCQPIEGVRNVTELKRTIESVQKALKSQEARGGASVEDLAKEVNKTNQALEMAQTDLSQMSALTKTLKSSITVRLARWHEFRRHIALRTKLIFQLHLSNRGYYGKVLFDHDTATLNLKVQTDDSAGTQRKEKDPRSLSGGEKSFSTICLLLALWEAIGCPIRCLDEFDVFMDAVNRRISMKMMIDTANASNKKQYILITPQDMTNIHVGTSVRVHRMTDPERGQGVLAFGSG